MGLAVDARAAVEIFVGDPVGHIRSNICSAPRQQGFSRIREYARLADLKAEIASAYVDLLVIDVEMQDSKVYEFVEEIRRTNLTPNPFMAIIATTWDARDEVVRRVVDTGVDDILAKPISVGKLLQRIDALAAERKPFVVTSSYIGPDRRSAREDDDGSHLIAVPNTLNAKSNGEELDIDQLREVIEQTQAQVNIRKLRENAHEIVRLIAIILPALTARGVDDEVRRQTLKAHALSQDTAARLRGTPFEGVADMCDALVNVMAALLETRGQPDPKDVELLQPLSKGLLVATGSGRDGSGKTGEIAASVESFTKARKYAGSRRSA